MLCDPHSADFTAPAEGPFLRSPLSLPYNYHTIHTRGQELEQAFPRALGTTLLEVAELQGRGPSSAPVGPTVGSVGSSPPPWTET